MVMISPLSRSALLPPIRGDAFLKAGNSVWCIRHWKQLCGLCFTYFASELRLMFKWTGVLGRTSYAWRAGFAVAFLIATILLFPFLLKAVMSGSHCAPDTCGALGLVTATLVRPILFIAALAIVLSICIRRARDAGLPPWLGVFPPLMLIGDQGFLQYAGAGWAYPFSVGILFMNAPFYALFGTALIVLLGLP